MAGIDLREISFRAHQSGDGITSPSLSPTAPSSTSQVALAAIKYRAKELGDAEN